eukprot:2628737-Rhodomonas_salina.1
MHPSTRCECRVAFEEDRASEPPCATSGSDAGSNRSPPCAISSFSSPLRWGSRLIASKHYWLPERGGRISLSTGKTQK